MFHDIRAKDSPPLLWYVDIAMMIVTEFKQDPNTKLEKMIPALFHIQGKGESKVYDIPLGVNVFNYITYQFNIPATFSSFHLHAHYAAGDEVWIVKGTQEDLGIPKNIIVHQLRNPVKY